MSAHTILQHIQHLFKHKKDEPPPVRERYPLDIKEALHAQYEAGRQSGLKEQAGLAGIDILEALHRKFQAGIQAGMRLGSPRCGKGHLLGAMKERFPGVFISICDVCSKEKQHSTRVLNLPVGKWAKIWNQSPQSTQVLPSMPKNGNTPEKP